ncbi:MAG: aminomethyl-transferring glycine dehydrogenase subunit GcvPA [Deltaproteobacteria bacterium]|nr:aminomethyl-transferring glycine dehydrogenase subunit GcvPA [Deltaproteobacteria bacterium]
MRYHPHSDADIAWMLQTIGASSIDALFDSIPKELQLKRPLEVPAAMDERSLLEHLSELAAKNPSAPAFLGAGAYPHHVPPAVDQLLLRSEFYTAYTPYQPEISQGTLQAVFEFQTFVTLLTGLDVANASMYDGATAAAEAALLAHRVHPDKKAVAVSRALHPSYRKVMRAYLEPTGIEVREIPFGPDGRTDLAATRKALDGVAGLVVGYPNFFGVVEPLKELFALAHDAGAVCVAATTEALSFGLLASPAELGADVAVGEMQSFGNGLAYGGPGLGFFAARESVMRQMPGRLVGITTDRKGRRGYVLTLATREQHIKREKATSNICTNNGLCALAATIHLGLLGKTGLSELAKLNWQRAHYARTELTKVGLSATFTGPVFNEFAIKGDVAALQQKLAKAGIDGGYPLGKDYPELKDSLLFCVTELHGKAAIDRLVAALR